METAICVCSAEITFVGNCTCMVCHQLMETTQELKLRQNRLEKVIQTLGLEYSTISAELNMRKLRRAPIGQGPVLWENVRRAPRELKVQDKPVITQEISKLLSQIEL